MNHTTLPPKPWQPTTRRTVPGRHCRLGVYHQAEIELDVLVSNGTRVHHCTGCDEYASEYTVELLAQEDQEPPHTDTWACDICGSTSRTCGCRWTEVPPPGPLPLGRPGVRRGDNPWEVRVTLSRTGVIWVGEVVRYGTVIFKKVWRGLTDATTLAEVLSWANHVSHGAADLTPEHLKLVQHQSRQPEENQK